METISVTSENDINNTVSNFFGNNPTQYKQELLDVGKTTMAIFNSKTSLIKTRMSKLLDEKEANSAIEKNLVKMKMTLVKICPTTNKTTLVSSILTRIFGEGNNSKKLIKVVSKYQSAEKIIDEIRKALHSGQQTLQLNNKELEELKNSLEDQLKCIKDDSIVLQIILEKLKNKEFKQKNKEKIDKMTNKLLIKLQDFKIMEEATIQFIMSINMANDNNSLLSDAVDRTCDITLQLMYSSLSIKAGIENQKKVINAMNATQKFASDLLIQNANNLQSVVDQTNEIYTSPVLDINKLKEAHNKLVEIVENNINIVTKNKNKLLTTIKELDNFKPLSIIDINKDFSNDKVNTWE